MDIRKIQLTGGSTYIVSLPKPWVRKKGLNVGDPIRVDEQPDGALILRGGMDSHKNARETEFLVKDANPDHLTRELIGLYLAGFSQIDIKMTPQLDAKVRSAVRHFTQQVIGPEIVDESRTNIVLLDLLDPVDFPMRSGLKRIYSIVRAMHEDVLSTLTDPNTDLQKNVIERDNEVNRIFWLINKQFNLMMLDSSYTAKMNTTLEQGMSHFIAARIFERIGDHSRKIADHLMDMEGVKIPSDMAAQLEKMGDQSIKILDSSVESFFNQKCSRAHDTVDMVGKLEKTRMRFLEQLREKRSPMGADLALISESIYRIGSYATDISETAINSISSSILVNQSGMKNNGDRK